MKILVVSDKIIDIIYTPSIAERMADIDLVISCGDLPNSYLEFIVTILNKPLYYVFGNHHRSTVYTEKGKKTGGPEGCINIDNRIVEHKGVLIAGFEGSMRYRPGKYQYSDFEMCMKISRLKPRLYANRLFKKKYVDILVTHAPPLGIHDEDDLCHRGFKCFNSFRKSYHPKYHLHGHIHYYGCDYEWMTEVNGTKVVNAYGFQVLEI